MKKKNVLNLIKYHTENNEMQFRNEALEIARYFDSIEDYQLSEYIMNLLSNVNSFIPQSDDHEFEFLEEIDVTNGSLPLPEEITESILGIINAVNHNIGINKFLFEGAPGTGKTESVKQVARLLGRKLYSVGLSELVDSKMGKTAKNIVKLFDEINSMPFPNKSLIIFDEIDAIALDRVNNNDLREMGRVTSSVLRELDKLNKDVVLVATTNLFENLDKAISRRFDLVVNFNQYSRDDLIEIACTILNVQINQFKGATRNKKLFKKILETMDVIPFPGDLQNMIKISLAFSDKKDGNDYLKRLLKLIQKGSPNIEWMRENGFTIREIETLSGKSKSQVSRELREGLDE